MNLVTTIRRTISTLVLTAVLFGALTPGIANAVIVEDPIGVSGVPTGSTLSGDGFPIVLPPLDCDSVSDEYVNGLFALGFSADGMADLFGEALGNGFVIVTFDC